MLLKILQLAIILILTIAFSNAASDLLIGGIGQSESDQKYLQEYAGKVGAIYVPTYLGDWKSVGIPNVRLATPKYFTSEVENMDLFAPYIKNDANGLNNDLLTGQRYDTIYAHSGGTRTAVTAMMLQDVTAKTLVLVSPIRGDKGNQNVYNSELKYLLTNNKVQNIVVYQSPNDDLYLGEFYQAKFDSTKPGIDGMYEDRFKVIDLNDDQLLKKNSQSLLKVPIISESAKVAAHKQMWYTALKNELGSSPDSGLGSFNFDRIIFGLGELQNTESISESNLGGVNLTSIKINYISVSTDQEDGVNFDFIVKARKSESIGLGIDPTNSTVIGSIAFMTGLAIPNEKFWVNLAPWEPDRIIDDDLKSSEVGRIMLEADLQMKKDFSNYGNPCASQIGKDLRILLDGKREALVQQCMRKFPGEIKDIDNVYFRPVTRLWIIPDRVYAYTNGTEIYIINATLTISSEPVTDHATFVVNNQDVRTLSKGCLEELNRSAREFSEYAKPLEDIMILPYVVADVNHGDKYEDLRNVYVALALAQWYKSKTTAETDIFRAGLDLSDTVSMNALGTWSPREIWEDYVYSFENGEYKCWDNTTTKTAEGTEIKSRLYSAGGVDFLNINDKLVEIDGVPPEIQYQVETAVAKGFVEDGDEVLFGSRVHITRSHEATASGSGSGSGSGAGTGPTPADGRRHSNANGGGNESSQNEEVAQVTCPEGWIGPNEKGECRRYIPLIPMVST